MIILKKLCNKRKKSYNKSFNLFDEETNVMDNFLYALKARETKRQYPEI
ncbi:MAG TPA: hypothetical protein VHJ38_01565 [Nitrososphaeraceae archaeon]|jgi:hypothetical protein|nr:hypothetical protein [Nitrososphaeraceae archaeon]